MMFPGQTAATFPKLYPVNAFPRSPMRRPSYGLEKSSADWSKNGRYSRTLPTSRQIQDIAAARNISLPPPGLVSPRSGGLLICRGRDHRSMILSGDGAACLTCPRPCHRIVQGQMSIVMREQESLESPPVGVSLLNEH